MVKSILLKCDEEFFEKLKADKLRRQAELGSEMTWEVYVAIIFGISKLNKNGSLKK